MRFYILRIKNGQERQESGKCSTKSSFVLYYLYLMNKAWVNPIAAARASGPKEVTGTTIRDYLDRDRPTM